MERKNQGKKCGFFADMPCRKGCKHYDTCRLNPHTYKGGNRKKED